MGLDDLQVGFSNTISSISEFISDNPVKVAVGAVGAGALASGLVAVAVARTKKKVKRKSRAKSSRKLKFGSKAFRKKYLSKHRRHRKKHSHRQKRPHTAGKRKDTSHKRIRFTKNNQPYVILASGKARFIKKSSVRRSRKMKGGRY